MSDISEPNAVGIVDVQDERGGTIRTITAVSLEEDTVTSNSLLKGYTAHDSSGAAIVGTVTSAEIMAEIGKHPPISGELSVFQSISATLSTPNTIQATLTIPSSSGAIYTGEYEVTPQPFADVVLETNGKRMRDDVTVFEIPYYTTTNPQGGYTAIIGG